VGAHTKKIDDFVEIILSTRVEHRLLGCYWPPTAVLLSWCRALTKERSTNPRTPLRPPEYEYEN
jgi:hypothetical protein